MNCTHCNDSAFVRCRKHRKSICGSAYCTSLHRWGRGDCEFVAANRRPFGGWRLHALRTAIALGVGLLVTWIVAL
jgi:hypothetical protein